MSEQPLLIEGAYGVRGPYYPIQSIPADRQPLLGSRMIDHIRMVVCEQYGYDRGRIRYWHNGEYKIIRFAKVGSS
jgi:hypothetical protein